MVSSDAWVFCACMSHRDRSGVTLADRRLVVERFLLSS
jgi:hypothetical protein